MLKRFPNWLEAEAALHCSIVLHCRIFGRRIGLHPAGAISGRPSAGPVGEGENAPAARRGPRDMSEEPSAISRISPAPGDYDSICAALMHTERGRWFLQEYARR